MRTLRLSAYALPGCAPDDADLPGATLQLTPLGDFAGLETPAGLPLLGSGPLELPEHTLALEGLAEAGDEEGKQHFLGYAQRGRSDDVPLLLWPDQLACDLDPDRSVMGSNGGQAMGTSQFAHLVLMAGGDEPSAPARSVAAATFDTGTGVVAQVTSTVAGDGGALSEPRAYATITSFGELLLVAGGENPLGGASAALPPASGTAELFDPLSRRFLPNPIHLTVERTRHAALVLANGDTLLVGGRSTRSAALTVLEVISPVTSSASIAGLQALESGRLTPAVLRLDDDRIFVGGGTAADGAPLAPLEWLSADAREYLGNQLDVPRRHDRAFTALPGGGVLAVGGCDVSEVACGGDCRAGCPPMKLDGTDLEVDYDAWWIDPQGLPTRIDLSFGAPRPVLLGGADGRPLLATGDSSDATLYRFNPWLANFERADATAATPPRAGNALAPIDGGAAVWFSPSAEGTRWSGLRWNTRERFAIDPELLIAPTPPTGEEPPLDADPFPLVPDRPPTNKVSYDSAQARLSFVANSPVTVYLGATDYANVAIDVVVEAGVPRLILGTREFGSASCPWPEGAENAFRLERVGDRVTLSSNGVAAPSCEGPHGRVRLGIATGELAMVVLSLRVQRNQE